MARPLNLEVTRPVQVGKCRIFGCPFFDSCLLNPWMFVMYSYRLEGLVDVLKSIDFVKESTLML